ncbi:hypothetical protein [Streptomyces sp. SID13726]|uniref:hypothetical protein n=1 Tax=Streptomyces sp. SID13726 TaxID=2706058 RepID=UPI0013BCA731|nr:hypothetical protein [Streptomyces sp. SID13726]NEB03893.1 hypothetical protein [Streptomyces sp. SID13726]
MSTHSTSREHDHEDPAEENRETLSGPQSIPRPVLLTGFLITALGGLTGLAAVVSALTGLGGGTGDETGTTPKPAPTPTRASASASASAPASVEIRHPQQAASARHHQKVYGIAVIPPHHTLWLASRKKGEAGVYLLGRAHIVKQGTGADDPTSWDACPQIGDYPAQRGASFEIIAALVPDTTSDYLLGARTYTGVQLVPADPAADVAGLVSTQLPPGTDTAHQDSVWVTLAQGGEDCA